jgi:hypothetical protein
LWRYRRTDGSTTFSWFPMADLFDALAARALGTTRLLLPALPPRFGPPTQESDPVIQLGEETEAVVVGELHAPVVPAAPDQPSVQPARWAQFERLSAHLGLESGPRAEGDSTETAALSDSPRPAETSISAPARPPLLTEHTIEHEVIAGPARTAGEAAAPPALAPSQWPMAEVGEPQRLTRDDRLVVPPLPVDRLLMTPLHAAGAERHPEARGPAEPVQEGKAKQLGPATEGMPAPNVTVSIGYVEVRSPAEPPVPQRVPESRAPHPRLSLTDYLRGVRR